MDMMGLMNRIINPVKQRIFMLICRGLVTAIRENPNGFQKVAADLLADESADGMDRYQEYGFASKPKAGANVLAAFLAGNRSHGVVVCIDDVRYRFTGLAEGEVCLSTCWDKNTAGHRIHFKADRSIEIFCSNAKVTASTSAEVYAPSVKLGDSAAVALLKASAADVYNAHTHLAAGSPTATPNAFMTGLGTTKVKGA